MDQLLIILIMTQEDIMMISGGETFTTSDTIKSSFV